MIASLPMYEREETVAAHDAFWSLISDQLHSCGIDAPQQLTRTDDPWSHWHSPNLLLSQTCGLPFRSELHETVNLVGTPDYGLSDTLPGHYFSVLIARADDPSACPANSPSATMAVNDLRSQSGWAAPLDHLGGPPKLTRLTGSHEASANSVAQGQADWAAIDAVSWRGITASSDHAETLRVFAKTRQTPGLPLITPSTRDPGPIADAVAKALQRLDQQHRDILGIRSLVRIPKKDYLSLPVPPASLG